MKLLLIGGPSFIGRPFIEDALRREHEVTVLVDEDSAPIQGVEVVVGRRSSAEALSALKGRNWDAAVDLSNSPARQIRTSAQFLSKSVTRYILLSSISVYADFYAKNMTENAPLAAPLDLDDESITAENFAGNKVRCEQEVRSIYGNRATVIRSGSVVGPEERRGRFTYWALRIEKGGEVLAPGRPKRRVQFIDSRDLAAFAVRLAETNTAGIFNATGPISPLTMRELLEEFRKVTHSDATFTWLSDSFLTRCQVKPEMLPLWVPEQPATAGSGSINFERALAAGLSLRPLAATIEDTLAWSRLAPHVFEAIETLSPEKEYEALRRWHQLSHPYTG